MYNLQRYYFRPDYANQKGIIDFFIVAVIVLIHIFCNFAGNTERSF